MILEGLSMDSHTLVRSGDPDTSFEAAEQIVESVTKIQRAVLDVFQAAGPNGLTDRELTERFTNLGTSTWRTRRSELTVREVIVDSGRRKIHRTTSGRGTRRHIVWVLKEYR